MSLLQADVQAALDAAVAAGRPARATLASRSTGRLVSVVLRPGSSDQLQPSKVGWDVGVARLVCACFGRPALTDNVRLCRVAA